MHLFSGGREIFRMPVNSRESVESLGKKIDEVASRVYQAGRDKREEGAGAGTGAVPPTRETLV